MLEKTIAVSGTIQKGNPEVQGVLQYTPSGSKGTADYNELDNKPSIEGNVLEGDKTFKQLGMDTLTIQEIEKILYLD